MPALLPTRGSRIITRLERAASMAEFAPSLETIISETNHLHQDWKAANSCFSSSPPEARSEVIKHRTQTSMLWHKQQTYPPLQVNHRLRGIVVDSSPEIAYNVSTWELFQRRKVLPRESIPNFIFVIYIGLGKGQFVGQYKVNSCAKCEYVGFIVLLFRFESSAVCRPYLNL